MWLLGKWILWPAFIIQQLQLWHGHIQLSPTAGNSTGVYVVSFSDLTWLIHSIILCSSNKQTIRNILSMICAHCTRRMSIGELVGRVNVDATRNWQIFVIFTWEHYPVLPPWDEIQVLTRGPSYTGDLTPPPCDHTCTRGTSWSPSAPRTPTGWASPAPPTPWCSRRLLTASPLPNICNKCVTIN